MSAYSACKGDTVFMQASFYQPGQVQHICGKTLSHLMIIMQHSQVSFGFLALWAMLL